MQPGSPSLWLVERAPEFHIYKQRVKPGKAWPTSEPILKLKASSLHILQNMETKIEASQEKSFLVVEVGFAQLGFRCGVKGGSQA